MHVSSWLVEELYDFLQKTFPDSCRAQVRTLIDEKRVHEVYVEPGRLSSRIVGENKRSERVVLNVPEYSSEDWVFILTGLSENSFAMAHVYNHILPNLFSSLAESRGLRVIPLIEECTLSVDDRVVPFGPEDLSSKDACMETSLEERDGQMNMVYVVALLEKFAELLIQAPLSIATLRGRNVEQLVHEVREFRAVHITGAEAVAVQVQSKKRQVLTLEEYYLGKTTGESPQIQVRADELPASVLRRIDHLPIDHIELDMDSNLEDAYGRVTRLAQSLARFLP